MKQKFLITTPSCPVCRNVEEFLTNAGRMGDVKIIDASTTDGLAFARNLGVSGVPECAIVEEDGDKKIARVCTPEEWRDLLGAEQKNGDNTEAAMVLEPAAGENPPSAGASGENPPASGEAAPADGEAQGSPAGDSTSAADSAPASGGEGQGDSGASS